MLTLENMGFLHITDEERGVLVDMSLLLEEYAVSIPTPWDADLDDLEAERFMGLMEAMRIARLSPSFPKGDTMKITDEMLDKGQHVLSEWLNDNAPIGERRYREPAKACFEAMLALTAAPTSAGEPSRLSILDERYRNLSANEGMRKTPEWAPDRRHFDILAEAMAEVKATSDGLSDQPIAAVAWQYRFEPNLPWHAIDYLDQAPSKPEWPDLELRPLYSAPPASEKEEIDRLRKALEWIANYGGSDLADFFMFDAKSTIIERLTSKAREALSPALNSKLAPAGEGEAQS